MFRGTLGEVLASIDFSERFYRRRMFLGRYAGQPMAQWDDVDTREVARYVDAVATLLREEADAVKKASTAAAMPRGG